MLFSFVRKNIHDECYCLQMRTAIVQFNNYGAKHGFENAFTDFKSFINNPKTDWDQIWFYTFCQADGDGT